jgi:hypothetical protein
MSDTVFLNAKVIMSQHMPSSDRAGDEPGGNTDAEGSRLEPGPEAVLSSRRMPVEINIKIKPKRILVGAGALIVVVGGTVAGLALTAGPSYPHPWCASTLNYMYTSTPTGTFQDFLNELQYEENQGAPTGQLLSDEQTLLQDAANVQSASDFSVESGIVAETIDMASAKKDAEAINRACGEPASYDIGKLGVPSGG